MKIVARHTIVAGLKKETVTFAPGDVFDQPDEDAALLIRKGAAVPFVGEPEPDEPPPSPPPPPPAQ